MLTSDGARQTLRRMHVIAMLCLCNVGVAYSQMADTAQHKNASYFLLESFGPCGKYALYYEHESSAYLTYRIGASVEYFANYVTMVAVPMGLYVPFAGTGSISGGIVFTITPAYYKAHMDDEERYGNNIWASVAIGPEFRFENVLGNDLLRVAFCGGVSSHFMHNDKNTKNTMPPVWIAIGYGVRI